MQSYGVFLYRKLRKDGYLRKSVGSVCKYPDLCFGLARERMFSSSLSPRDILVCAKYRQHGYQDNDRERQKPGPAAEKPVRKDTFGPRPLHMTGTHSVSRCAQCGTLLTLRCRAGGAMRQVRI